MVRMKDVAEHAGISVATVSNVITGKQYVSDDVKEAVENSIAALGYKVNLMARGLKSKQTYTIGIILPDITKMFFPDVLKGIEDAAKIENYKINFLSSDFDFEVEKQNVEYLKASCVDGVIIDSCCDRRNRAQWAEELISGGGENKPFHVVSIEQDLNPKLISSVLVDYEALSKEVTDHLISLGRKSIIYIKSLDHLQHGYDRLAGYQKSLADHGIDQREELILSTDFSAHNAYKAIKQALAEGLKFDAVQAVNDQAAIGAMKALIEANISVPDDVAIAGFDNIFPSTLVSPQISTIDIPRYQLGFTAFEELKRLMDNKGLKPRRIMLNGNLIIRQSTVKETLEDWNLNRW